MSETKAKIAIGIDFMKQFASLPRKVQSKATSFMAKFQSDPTGSGINYETIKGMRDSKLHSVRIGDDYRGIVCKPERGNVYMLLWVDHHDEAYEWARKRTVRIHPQTGVPVVEVAGEELTPAVSHADTPEKDFFHTVSDKTLIRLGVSEEYLGVIRMVKTEEDFDRVRAVLPETTAEPLVGLAAGYTPEEVYANLSVTTPEKVDTDDYSTAMDRVSAKRHFVVVNSELELQRILQEPLALWRVFLHPTQRRLVERDWNGPVRVLGGAGTGKTVVAMHRARWLADHRLIKDSDRILFTTFTRNLSEDIRKNLEKLTPSNSSRIEVINLDAWVARFLKNQGVGRRITYKRENGPLWSEALAEQESTLGLPDAFYRDEWEQVVQPQSLVTRDEYFRARRVGRGTRLTRAQRWQVWRVFGRYRELLASHDLLEPEDAMREARRLITEKNISFGYGAVIVDEAQDMDDQAFMLLRTIAGPRRDNDMLIVGDPHQRIYRKKTVLGRCGIDIRGRGRKLRLNYRTTEQIRRHAVAVLRGVTVDDLDGSRDDNRGYHSLLHGPVPEVKGFSSFEEEMRFVCDAIAARTDSATPGASICIVARCRALLVQVAASLSEAGIEHVFLKTDNPDDGRCGVRLGTMHRVKGLEFETVIAVGMGADQYPALPEGDLDPVARRTFETQERSLLYVTLTRARNEALVTYHGKASEVVASPH